VFQTAGLGTAKGPEAKRPRHKNNGNALDKYASSESW
jgi:hypothetical protein